MFLASLASVASLASAVPPSILLGSELVGLGLGAGVLTTIAGQGGGLLLLLACSMLVGPHQALAITAPALLLGNLHRATILRHAIVWRIALRVVVGVVPGALVGGLIASVTPPWVLHVLLVVMTALAIAKAGGLLRFRVSDRALGPAGFFIGGMTGTSGGAGILFAPLLLSSGLSGRAFVATSAVIAFTSHVGRVIGYGALGLFSRDLFLPTAVVTTAILCGNAVGDRLRRWMGAPSRQDVNAPRQDETSPTDRITTLLEYGTLVLCVALSVAGLG